MNFRSDEQLALMNQNDVYDENWLDKYGYRNNVYHDDNDINEEPSGILNQEGIFRSKLLKVLH